MLTSRSVKFIALFCLLLVVGLLLGNRILIYLSLLSLCFLGINLFLIPPQEITLVESSVPTRAFVGDVVEIKYRIRFKSGIGLVTLHQDLSPGFSLQKGSNLRVIWKGWKIREYTFSYSIRCSKRGQYSFLPIKWEANHLLRMRPTQYGQIGEQIDLDVQFKLMNLRRIRYLRGLAAEVNPVMDMAKIGVETTDFREIRQYHAGDPIKNINWKATARLTNPEAWPLTNEYEVEGKKTVWIFMDASRSMEVGTDLRNALEYSLQAAEAILYFYLDRGYRVGMYVFNNQQQLFYPETGKKQFVKISRELLKIKAGSKSAEFPAAVEKCRSYILGYNPLCVVITRLDSRFADNIIQGVNLLRKMRGRSRHSLPVMVINLPGYSLLEDSQIYDENASILMQLNARPRIQSLRRLGASIVNWNPNRQGLAATLLQMVKSR
jgi:uncharacterized protein (DUF58 family)